MPGIPVQPIDFQLFADSWMIGEWRVNQAALIY